MNHNVSSPCIGICKLEEFCIGCGRSVEEITSWMYYTQEQAEKALEESYKRLWENKG